MKATGSYDATLQMFRDLPREADLSRLRFLRWLGERGRLEHPVAGASVGAFAGDFATGAEPIPTSPAA